MYYTTFFRESFKFLFSTFALFFLCLALKAQKVYTYEEYCNSSKEILTRSEAVLGLSVSQVKHYIEQNIPTLYINSRDDIRVFAKEGETLARVVTTSNYLPLIFERGNQTKNLSTIILKLKDKNELFEKIALPKYTKQCKDLKIIFIQCYFPIKEEEVINFVEEDPNHPVLVLYQYAAPS